MRKTNKFGVFNPHQDEDELVIANVEKVRLTAELKISNMEKEIRTAELYLANVEKEIRAAELEGDLPANNPSMR